MKSTIQTVLGNVSPDALGHIQCHEHIWLDKGPSFEINSALCADDYPRSLQELKDYAAAGGGAIVDAQPGGFGRSAAMLRRLSEASGVQIIAVTGFHKLQFMETEAKLDELSTEELTARFCADIAEGMIEPDGSRSAAKAGIVKAAYEPNAFEHPVYARLMEAVAAAARQTGAPVMIHTEKNTSLPKLISFFADRGVAADRILICHLDRTNFDRSAHIEALDAGCMLCYDSIHRYKYVSDADERARIADMCKSGYDRQIVLSLDTTNQRLRAYHSPDMGLDYILTDFIPLLRQDGIGEESIRRMCRENAPHILQMQQ